MPTTPNPTPPDEDDGGPTVPSSPTNPPVTDPDEEWLVHRPNVLNRGVSYPRAEINYVEKFMSVTNKASFFQSFPATQYPHPPMFDGVCPGHWSRQYPDMGAAAALASGSGYFGYVGTGILNPDKWWSTNFVDDPVGEDLPATAVTSKGQYHSKNSALAAEENITALVIVSKDTVTLKWGSSWGLVTKNSTYDRRAADGSIQPELHILPRSSDGSPDLEMLEKTIMNKAPVTGSFVIVDFKRNSYVFTTVDGAYAQYTAIDEANRPTRDVMPFEQSPLPLTSSLSFLPAFTSGPVSVTASFNFSMRTSLAGMDYSRTWLKAFVGYAAAASSGQQPNQPSQEGSRVSPASLILADLSRPSYIGYGDVSRFTGNATWATWFSGWLRTGTPTQMVGWLLNTGVPSAAGFVVTPYGFTSLSPTANRVGFGEKYMLTSTDTQAEILSMLYVGGSVGAMGFAYDASIGEYGEVTWLSMI